MKKEEFKVKGKDVVQKVKDIIHEGNIRSIYVKDKNDKTVFQLPVTFSIAGAIIAPWVALLGAAAAFLTECKIVVIKDVDDEDERMDDRPFNKGNDKKNDDDSSDLNDM